MHGKRQDARVLSGAVPFWVVFIVLPLVPLAATFVIGATLPRWASFVPALICMGLATYAWLAAKPNEGDDNVAALWLVYGAVYGGALLLAAAGGRLARRDRGD